MVHIYRGELGSKMKSQQPGKRMPMLCAYNRSFGWRIISENYEDHPKGIRSDIYDVNKESQQKEDYITSMALCDDTGVIALGSGRNEGNLYFVKDMSAIKDIESDSRFETIHVEAIGKPIHSLDWSGSHLVVGTNKGTTLLYEIDSRQQVIQVSRIGEYVNTPAEVYTPSMMPNTHVKAVEFSPSYSSSSIDPISRQFLSTTLNQVAIWDITQTSAPIDSRLTSTAPLYCASWSPNHPKTLIVSGGIEKKLSIFDIRVKDNAGIVWTLENAHDRPIRAAKFNPFIPYWLASGGEDSLVNIWDIRSTYKGPVAKIDGILGMVTSLTWSNIRPENIGTTSSDGISRFWTLSPESLPIWDTFYRIAAFSNNDTLPMLRYEEDNVWNTKGDRFKIKATATKSWMDDDDEFQFEKPRSTMMLAGALGLGEWGRPEPGSYYKGENLLGSKGPVVAMLPSKLRPSMYYGVTSVGQLGAYTVRFDMASNLRSRHRYDPKDKNEIAAQIEDDIYCRRITEAHRKMDILKSTPKDDAQAERQRQEEIEFLEDCLRLPKAIQEQDWAFQSVPNKNNRRVSRRLLNGEDSWEMSVQQFKSDLKYWSYRIPPGYNTEHKFPLEIKEPIIAPHLIVEEHPPLQIPTARRYRGSAMLSISSDLEDDVSEYGDGVGITLVLDESKSDNVSPNQSSSIQERRSAISVSPIVTVDNAISTNPFTPPTTANTLTTPPVISSTNPFEQNITCQSPVQSPQQESTNPFEEKTTGLPTEGKKSHSWVARSLSRSSTNKSEDEDSKKHRFNPFKKFVTRTGSTIEEHEEPNISNESTNLSRKPSDRRNALHGPF